MKRIFALIVTLALLALPSSVLALEGGVCGLTRAPLPTTPAIHLKDKYYNTTIQSISLSVENNSQRAFDARAGFKLDCLKDGKWVPAEKSESAAGGIWNVMPLEAGARFTTDLQMDGFRQPFPPGTYRITKTFLPCDQTGETVDLSEYFQIMDPRLEMSLQGVVKLYPNSNELTAFSPGDSYINGYPHPFEEVMQELRRFQLTGKPDEKALMKANETVTLLYRENRSTPITFYYNAFAVYAHISENWYIAPEPQLLNRLENIFDAFDGSFSTGEELVSKLQEQKVLKPFSFEKHTFSTPFPYPGWRAALSRDGEQISIFQFPDASAANQQLQHVSAAEESSMNYSVTLPNQNGGYTNTKIYHWVYPPHYYQSGPFVILYNGNDEDVLFALNSVGRSYK